MHFRKVPLLLFALVALGFIFPASSMAAEKDSPKNQIYEAVEGLKENNIYRYQTAELSLEPKLQEALKDSSIGVVVIPGNATMESYTKLAERAKDSNGYEYDNFAEAVYDFAKKDGYRTVIVLSKNNFVVASNQSVTSIESMLEGTSALNPEKILLTQEKVEDYNEIRPGEWMWFIIVPLGLAGAFFSLLFLPEVNRSIRNSLHTRSVARNKRKSLQAAQKARENLIPEVPKDIPKELRDKLNNIQKWATVNVAKKDQPFALELKVMIERFQILFERIQDRGTDQQKSVALVGYNDMLRKISSALSDKYYLDILANPQLWDEPEERISQVKRAVAGTSHQLLENIKQVNASQDLDFKASLEALAGFMESPKVEDMYGDKE